MSGGDWVEQVLALLLEVYEEKLERFKGKVMQRHKALRENVTPATPPCLRHCPRFVACVGAPRLGGMRWSAAWPREQRARAPKSVCKGACCLALPRLACCVSRAHSRAAMPCRVGVCVSPCCTGTALACGGCSRSSWGTRARKQMRSSPRPQPHKSCVLVCRCPRPYRCVCVCVCVFVLLLLPVAC